MISRFDIDSPQQIEKVEDQKWEGSDWLFSTDSGSPSESHISNTRSSSNTNLESTDEISTWTWIVNILPSYKYLMIREIRYAALTDVIYLN